MVPQILLLPLVGCWHKEMLLNQVQDL